MSKQRTGWTSAQLEEFRKKRPEAVQELTQRPDTASNSAKLPPLSPKTGQDSGNGVPKLPRGRQPNKTEQRFLDICEARKKRGEILSYRYEGCRLKWGVDPKTGQAMHYKPDVLIQEADGTWVCIETKGRMIRSRDVVRLKGARAEWPELRFEMHQWVSGAWTRIL